MPRKWTAEQKQRQRELIQNWQPWKASTGPTTLEGKSTASQNGVKYGFYTAAALAERQKLREAIDSFNRFADLYRTERLTQDNPSEELKASLNEAWDYIATWSNK